MDHGHILALAVCSREQPDELAGGLKPSLADHYQELDALVSDLPEDRQGALDAYLDDQDESEREGEHGTENRGDN
jgi:hypothetical protein